jgi:two-component system sensor histidine kinase TctE
VTLHRSQPTEFGVVMGQTTTSRTRLLKRLLVLSSVPQVILLFLLAWWLRRTIQGDMRPLLRLQHAIDSRDANDLGPLPREVRAGAAREIERIGDAVDSLLSRLQASLQAQREFAGNVAHELRTPLAGIRAHASFALAQDEPAVWREQLRGIAQAEQRASRLVDQLLAIARAAEGSTSLQLEPIALNELVRDVVLRFLPRADAGGVDLGAEGLDQPLMVRGNRALLEGMLSNLLDNAFRHGLGDPPRITVEASREGDQVVLRVIDNGPGLEGHDPQQLTQRWKQGTSGQAIGQGAGLGLAIVARYAELLGARFDLTPAPGGQGLCAELRFRAAAA